MNGNYHKHRASVLLVENSPEDIKEISRVTAQNYDLVYSSDIEQTLALLQNKTQRISAAIIPIEKALEITKKIRGISSLENMPILVSTDDFYPELEEQLLDLDIIDFLKKPFNEARMNARLRTAVKLSEANNIINELERDDLTGLLTRQAFLHKAGAIRSAHPEKLYYILAFDFENFKSSNTLYGEQKCNEFLTFIAKRLGDFIPHAITGRFGGDQFVLFMEYEQGIDVEKIKKLKRYILDSAPIPHQVAKIGIYAPIDSELQLNLCCDRAFLAIHEIKGKYGKEIAFYENSFQQQLLDEQRIIETMERALEENQFQIFYQPKHETITGKIAGAEALVRWNHPEYGFMSPNQFIPLFERNGFITKLDLFILTQVCKDIKRWQQDGFPLIPVSVNISRRDFMEPGCIEKLFQIIDEYQISHSLLHMEVTESLYSENTDLIISQLKKTQEQGFSIEMDDFGSGYSSLGLLSSFPLDIIKLDISFVKNIKSNEVVIENIIKMAHTMGLMTVAEGAESVEQFKMLKTLGCDFIQGFYFSKPLPVTKFESYLKKSSVLIKSQANATQNNDKHMDEATFIAANEIADILPGGFFSYHADDKLEIISFNSELMNITACENSEEFRAFTNNSFKGIVGINNFENIQKSIKEQITPENDIYCVEYELTDKKGNAKKVRNFGKFVKTEKYGNIFYAFINVL